MSEVEDTTAAGSSSGVGKNVSFVDIYEDDNESVVPVNDLSFKEVAQLVYSVIQMRYRSP